MQVSLRPFSSLLSRKAVLPAVVLAIASVALAGRAILSSPIAISAPPNSPAHESVIQPLAGPAQNSRIRTELITIRPTGFDPGEIRVADGHFRIAVDNKSGLDEVTLRLTREGGARVRELRLPPGQLKWREKLNLPAGIYLLTEANHANWSCRIIVAS